MTGYPLSHSMQKIVKHLAEVAEWDQSGQTISLCLEHDFAAHRQAWGYVPEKEAAHEHWLQHQSADGRTS